MILELGIGNWEVGMGNWEFRMGNSECGSRTRRRPGRKGLWRGKHGEFVRRNAEVGIGNGECGMRDLEWRIRKVY